MLVGFDTEFSFDIVREIRGRPHGDITTIRPVCACLVFQDGRELRLTDNWGQLQDLFDDPCYTFTVQGCHAEALFCSAVGVRFPSQFLDTLLMGVMLMHALTFHLDRGVYAHAGLGKLTARYGIPFLATDDKDAIRTSIMYGRHLQEYGMDAVLDYCTDDARATVQLVDPLRADFIRLCGPNAEQNLLRLYQPYALLMAAAARKGLRFDTDGWGRLVELAPRYRGRLLNEMRAAGYDHDGEGLGDRAFHKMIFNLGLERSWPRTPMGHLRTREDDLKSRRHLHPAINATHKLGKFDSFMNQDMGGRVDFDGRLRCSILPLAQRSSRNSTVQPNLMGILGELRPLLLADEGFKLIHFDYSQQEPGVAAYLSRDQALLQDFRDGDVYLNLGLRMGLVKSDMPLVEQKQIRKSVLKSLMLAILYGKSAGSIARDVPCCFREAVMHLNSFSTTYSRLVGWLKSYVTVSMERGFAENIIGFRAAFNVIDPPERGHVSRSCQNFPIQSSAAACFQLTGLYLADFGADIRLPLHDAYLIQVPDDPRIIDENRFWVESATTAATNQLFPGLAVKRDIEVLDRFAKDGEEDSFEKLLGGLEAEQCVEV